MIPVTEINYPEGLPHPLVEGHTTQHVQPFRRTTMASGRAVQRRIYTSVPSMGNYSLILNDSQAAAFEVWFKVTLLDGAEWFNMPRRTPLGQSMLVCRFTGIYSGPNIHARNRWLFTFELESWERPVMPDEWALLPDYLIYAGIFDLAMNREWPLVSPTQSAIDGAGVTANQFVAAEQDLDALVNETIPSRGF